MHMLYARIRKHDGKCSLATVLNLTSVLILWLNLPSPFLSPGSNSIQNRGMRRGKGQQLQQFTTLQALHLCSIPRNIITQLCSTLYDIYLFIKLLWDKLKKEPSKSKGTYHQQRNCSLTA